MECFTQQPHYIVCGWGGAIIYCAHVPQTHTHRNLLWLLYRVSSLLLQQAIFSWPSVQHYCAACQLDW